MSISANLGTLLRFYATRQGSAFVSFHDFCDYLKKYAEHHVEEQADLVKYLGNPEDIVQSELEKLAEKHLVYFLDRTPDKLTIIVIMYFTVQYAQRYKEISTNPSIPFPSIADLPKQVPFDAIESENATDLFPVLFAGQDLKSPRLFCVQLPHDVPPILLPECIPVNILTNAAMAKLRTMLKKEEYHDYFLKKLRNANPGKELSTQTFFDQIISRPDTALQSMETSGDAFYFWSQLCYFVRQDFEKVKDMTLEDTNLLQSVSISELYMLMLKNKIQKQQQKQDALRDLEQALNKPPYFYSMQGILKLTDAKGIPLHGRYSDADLKNFLETLTSESKDTELPRLLVFKIDSGMRYFVYKTKVFPLIVRLCNEAHDIVEKKLIDKWFNVLENYEKLSEMHGRQEFEECIKKEVEAESPVLYALLNSNFLPILDIEMQNDMENRKFKLFSDGHLLPYSKLLMLDCNTILSSAKIMLPFWYIIPVISQIVRFFMKRPKTKKTVVKSANAEYAEEKKPEKNMTKREALAAAAKKQEERFIPAGSTIDRELDSYCNQWNKLITKEAHIQLTEDVNSLIRDYMRKVIHTISANTFTTERIGSLAETLIKTPNMQKITDQDALYMYTQLYILRLVENG
ncbi:MAG: hypothetical protein WCR31_01830 [Treponema sp.]